MNPQNLMRVVPPEEVEIHFRSLPRYDFCQRGIFLSITIMIAPEETTGASAHDASREALPASTRVYVNGEIHPQIRVPMREIAL
jgi:hypothetical protein